MNYLRNGAFVATTCIALLSHPAAVAAQGLDIDSLVLKTIADLASAVPSFTDAESALQSAIAGNKPNKPVSFSQLADQARAVAEDLKNPPAPPWSNWATYAVSMSDLQNCSTHGAAMSKLQANSANLQKAVSDGRQKLAKIDDSIKQAQAAQKAAVFLDENLQKVIALPWYGSVFVGDMLDVHNKVVPAFGGLITALTKYRSQFSTSLDQATAQSDNLKANLSQMSNWNPMAGFWHASGSGGGTDFGGGSYVRYHVDFSNLNLQLSIDGTSRIASAVLQGVMTERPINAHVGVIPTNTHHFNLAGGGVSGLSLNANFAGTAQNAPKTSASFSGTFVNNCSAIQGSVRVWRTDIGAPFNWNVGIPVTLVH
jgi:hypothetical protein